MKKFMTFLSVCLLSTLGFLFVGCNNKKSFDISILPPAGITITSNKVKATAGEEVNLEYSLKEGYVLEYITLNDQKIESTTFKMPKADAKISAVLSVKTYTITYHLESDATNAENNPTTYTVESPTLQILEPTRPGYDFYGWFSNPQLSISSNYVVHGSYGDLNLYPHWEKTNYYINYHLDNGVNAEENKTTFNFDDRLIQLSPATKEGFEFRGWYTSPDFETPITEIDPATKRNYDVYAKFISTTTDQDGYRLITSKADFIEIVLDSENLAMNFRLKANIDLSSVNDLRPIGTYDAPYTGTFDGNGYAITGASLTLRERYIGLFGAISGATIKNLTLSMQIVVTSPSGTSTIEQSSVGCLVGYANNSSIENCKVISNDRASSIMFSDELMVIMSGGLIGQAQSTTITKCLVDGVTINAKASQTAYIGGVSGSGGNLSQCVYSDSVGAKLLCALTQSGATANIGGIIGYASDNTITDCYYLAGNASEISGVAAATQSELYVGGVAGRVTNRNSTIKNCYASINKLSATAPRQGSKTCCAGVVGSVESAIVQNCFVAKGSDGASLSSNGSTQDLSSIGMVVGNVRDIRISNCYGDKDMALLGYSDQSYTFETCADRATNEIYFDTLENILTEMSSVYGEDIWEFVEQGLPTLRFLAEQFESV